MAIPQQGLSLIELMVVVAVSAIGLSLAVPGFAALFANNRMSAATNDLVASLQTARTEAIKRQATVTVCATPGGVGSCAPDRAIAEGWTVYVDTDGDGAISEGEALQRHRALSDEFVAGFATVPEVIPARFDFQPRGTLALEDPGIVDIQLCDARGNRDTGAGVAAARRIRINYTGRIELHRTLAELQDPPAVDCP